MAKKKAPAKKAPKNFIQGAIKHPGALTKKAKAAGKTVAQYIASPPKNASPETMKQINFAKMLKGLPRHTGPRKKKK